MRSPIPLSRLGPASVLAAAALLTAGCSTAGSGSSSADTGGGTVASEGPTPKAGVAAAPGTNSFASMRDGGSSTESQRNVAIPDETRKVISTGRVSLVSRDLDVARTRINRLLAAYGGWVADEATTNDRSGRPSVSRLTLRIPSPHFTDLMDAFPTIATVKSTDVDATDVTTKVIDVDSRVRTEEVSLARLRKFLSEAPDTDDLIRIEREITRREAALESTKAEQKYLADQTSLGTVSVTMRTPAPAAAPPKEHRPAGFLGGLSRGWHALATAASYTATGIGAALPFLVLLGLLGVPAALVVRSLRRRTLAVAEQPGE